MYIDANDVKNYMNLTIHKEIADFINKTVAESQTMYFEDLKMELMELLEQEVVGETISDIGAGIEMAITKVEEKIKEFAVIN